jgi:hypothetical protein
LIQENEISFQAGDHIEIIELCNNVTRILNQDWYEGIVNGQAGFFPANHVRLFEVEKEQVTVHSATTTTMEATKVEANGTHDIDVKDSSPVKEQPESDGESDAGTAWHVVTTETGQVYYWNEETGQTSWTPPDEFGEVPPDADITTPVNGEPSEPKPSLEIVTDHIEIVPPELVRREGPLSYRVKKDFGGIEPKRAHSWHTAWGVICVGFLIFYKDEPAKLKKVPEIH